MKIDLIQKSSVCKKQPIPIAMGSQDSKKDCTLHRNKAKKHATQDMWQVNQDHSMKTMSHHVHAMPGVELVLTDRCGWFPHFVHSHCRWKISIQNLAINSA